MTSISSFTVGNIEHPSTTSVVTIVFSSAIGDSNINSFITNTPSSASSLSTLTSSDGGITWTGTLTGTAGYTVSQAKMDIAYTGGVNGSANYDISMTSDGKSWNELFSVTDPGKYMGNSSVAMNSDGTIIAFDKYQETVDVENGYYPHVEVYENQNGTWTKKGSDLAVASSPRVHFCRLNESGDHVVINLAPDEGTIVYEWTGSDWTQKGSIIPGRTEWSAKPQINNDGTVVGIIGNVDTRVYEWSGTAWVQKGTSIVIGGGAAWGYPIFNSLCDRISFYYRVGVSFDFYTYEWNSGTSDWEQTDSTDIGLNIADFDGSADGTKFVASYKTGSGGYSTTKTYEWTGSTWSQYGDTISDTRYYNGGGVSIAIKDDGNTFFLQLTTSTSHGDIVVYDLINNVWVKRDLEMTQVPSHKIAINTNGTIFVGMDPDSSDGQILVNKLDYSNSVNVLSMTPSTIKFPSTTATVDLVLSHSDILQADVNSNMTVSNNALGSLGSFTSSENGFKWSATFTANTIDSTGTIDYANGDMTGTINIVIDTFEKPISNICFYADSEVLTDAGYKKIKNISNKDTIRGRKIKKLTKTKSNDKYVVKMSQSCIFKNMPNKDTYISKEHKVLHNGKMIEAKQLLNLNVENVEKEKYNGETLYNILLEGDDEGKMIVNGMIVETLNPKNNVAKLYTILSNNKGKESEIINIFNNEKQKLKKSMLKNK